MNPQKQPVLINGKSYFVTEMLSRDGSKKYEIRGGDSIYFLYPKASGEIRCTCPGFRYNGRCRHQQLAPVTLKRYPLATMRHMASTLLELLPFRRVEVCGSVRRQAFTCKDLDFVILTDSWGEIENGLSKLGNWKSVKAGGELISGVYCDIPVDFTRVDQEREWPFMTLYRTGSKETNIKMRGRAKGWGWKLNERGLWDVDGSLIDCEDEEEIFVKLDLQYKEPIER
jgi:DNA polymerase/3'-5' exonuclease PolX